MHTFMVHALVIDRFFKLTWIKATLIYYNFGKEITQ